jgi:dihydroflavonol-4-reductase
MLDASCKHFLTGRAGRREVLRISVAEKPHPSYKQDVIMENACEEQPESRWELDAMKSVLVLGASGFIGGHIARAALDRGWDVRGLRRRSEATGHLGEAPVRWFEGDIDQPEGLTAVLDGVEIVFHAAGYYPSHARDVPGQVAHAVQQTRGILNVVRQAAVARVIYTSSMTTIGAPPVHEARFADERDLYIPGSVARSAYYECKYAMESEMLRAALAGFPVVVVNPTAVFGPGDHHQALGGVLLAVARGLAIGWLPASINVVDVREVAAAQIQAAEVGNLGERYILGGHNETLHNLLGLMAEIAGVRPPRIEIPLKWVDLVLALSGVIPALDRAGNHLRAIRTWQAYNCSKAERELGMTPRPLRQTLEDALSWYQVHGYLEKR